MVGETVAHYVITRQIGQGGMGVVYEAHHEQLDRTVALKFLPLARSDDEEEHALKTAPDNAEAYRALGRAYASLQQFDKAEAAYKASVATSRPIGTATCCSASSIGTAAASPTPAMPGRPPRN